MNLDSPLAWKRRRLRSIDPMEAEAANRKLETAKEKYGKDIRVFETLKGSQPATEVANSEETDEFFEFTADDYHHIMAAKKEDKFLKTRKIRDAETAARRARVTKAVIRIRFPDGHTLEATFHPSEPLQSIFDLLKKVLLRPEQPFYLYTTPPKRQIKDTAQNFFDAGFIPGAIVHFSFDLPKDAEAYSDPFLQEDVMELKDLELVPESIEDPVQPAQQTVATEPPVIPERKPADKKAIKPKWLKM